MSALRKLNKHVFSTEHLALSFLLQISPFSCALWTYLQNHSVHGLNFPFLLTTFEFFLFFYFFFWLAQQSRGKSTLSGVQEGSKHPKMILGCPAGQHIASQASHSPQAVCSIGRDSPDAFPPTQPVCRASIWQLVSWITATLGPYHSVQISLQSRSSQEWEVMLSGWVALGSPKLCNHHLWFFLSLCSPLVRVDGENTTPQTMPLNLSNFKGQIPSTAIFTLCDHSILQENAQM